MHLLHLVLSRPCLAFNALGSTLLNSLRFLDIQISSITNAMFRDTLQVSWAGMSEAGGSMMKDTISLANVKFMLSTLRPQQAADHRAQANGHLKKMCSLSSCSALHNRQDASTWLRRTWRLAFVGMALTLILHINILSLSGMFAFQSLDQQAWG